VLTEAQAVAQARELKQLFQGERGHLDLIRRYWKGVQQLPEVIPTSAPREVRMMARIARVNVCKIIIDTLAQSLFVDNFRANGDADDDGGAGGSDSDIWAIWQKNKMDARQSAIHRAAAAYGAAYAVVLPGTPVPVIRPVSPRHMLAAYEEDPDWPLYALEFRGTFGGKKVWRLYDNQAVYELRANNRGDEFDFVETLEHNAGVTPVIRYLDEDDLDADDDVVAAPMMPNYTSRPMRGQIAPMMTVQDQIDLTTFSLKVAEWYAAFRQRWAIGWVPDDEAQKMKASASQLWAFDATPDEMKVGEFDQTDLDGYIKSREASIRHAATLSQTPVHELIGELVNLSAEALAAAEQGHERKVDERKTLFGESHEQTLRLAGTLAGITIPDDAEVVWRDTSARSFAATVDGLGKLVTMLGVPEQMLWERIPGVTRQDVERWVAEAKTGNSFDELAQILERQQKPPAPRV
jgi:hypothetical protein